MFTFHNSHGKSTVQVMYLHPLFLQQNAIKLNPFFASDKQKKNLNEVIYLPYNIFLGCDRMSINQTNIKTTQSCHLPQTLWYIKCIPHIYY